MRALIRFLLYKPILWFVNNFSSDPDRTRVFTALSALCQKVEDRPGKKGYVMPFDPASSRIIIFSDQHKGRRNGADDFLMAEKNYLHALHYYNEEKFHLIALGDSEELWENTLAQVRKNHTPSFEAERGFARRNAFTKIFGNHDLDWAIDPLASEYLKDIYGVPITALEAVLLKVTFDQTQLNIFCTHGHQGDRQSDGNWFSKFFIAKIWAPLQAYIHINPNTPSNDQFLKTTHNNMMYEWSSEQHNLILITGHTHQPVFESLTHLEQLQRSRAQALREHNAAWAQSIEDEISWRGKNNTFPSMKFENVMPSYFNTGCCCYEDGDITGIELADGYIRLIKWEETNTTSKRIVLTERKLSEIARALDK